MTYTIISTTGGVSGRFASLVENGNYTGAMTLDYTTNPDYVYLDLGAEFLVATPSGGSQNQQDNVVNGIDNYILSGGTPPANFQTLASLSGQAYLNALTQLDGEDATGAEKSAFQSDDPVPRPVDRSIKLRRQQRRRRRSARLCRGGIGKPAAGRRARSRQGAASEAGADRTGF